MSHIWGKTGAGGFTKAPEFSLQKRILGMSSFLSIKNLHVEFKTKELFVQALKAVSFDIKPGEALGVVGESGSGKSVTALSIMRLLSEPPGKITEGQILLEGEDLLRYSEKQMRSVRGNRISMIFQEPMSSLNPVFTVGWQIDEALILHQGLGKKTAREKTVDLLDQVGVRDPSNRAESYPHELSGGQRQRVMIAMAIACRPDLLIADEPTTALDVTIQKQIIELIQNLQEKMKMSVMFISHDLALVAEMAQRVLLMYKGGVVEEGSVSDIFKNPKQPYTKGLLACRPRLDTKPARLPVLSDFTENGDFKKNKKGARAGLSAPPAKKPVGPVLLEIKDLKKYFPVQRSFFGKPLSYIRAVDGISLKLHKGACLGLVGESGCGKTTLGRLVLRLISADSGSVFYKGKNISRIGKKEMKSLRKKMQIIFQDPYASLNPRMMVGASLMEPMIIHGLFGGKKEREERVSFLMEQVGLSPEMKSRYPHEFSGGQRQRICIARAVAIEPEFIVCDESVSSLDVSIQAQILNLLKDLQEKMNLTYIFISHDLAVVKFISDHIAVMNKGKIVEHNTAGRICQSPQNPYTQRLIKAVPAGLFARPSA